MTITLAVENPFISCIEPMHKICHHIQYCKYCNQNLLIHSNFTAWIFVPENNKNLLMQIMYIITSICVDLMLCAKTVFLFSNPPNPIFSVLEKFHDSENIYNVKVVTLVFLKYITNHKRWCSVDWNIIG